MTSQQHLSRKSSWEMFQSQDVARYPEVAQYLCAYYPDQTKAWKFSLVLSCLIIEARMEKVMASNSRSQASKQPGPAIHTCKPLSELILDHEAVYHVHDTLKSICAPALQYKEFYERLLKAKKPLGREEQVMLDSLWETYERQRNHTRKYQVVKYQGAPQPWPNLETLTKVQVKASTAYGIGNEQAPQLPVWTPTSGYYPDISKQTILSVQKRMNTKLDHLVLWGNARMEQCNLRLNMRRSSIPELPGNNSARPAVQGNSTATIIEQNGRILALAAVLRVERDTDTALAWAMHLTREW